MSKRRILGPIAGLILSAIFLALALYHVDFTAVWHALGSADYRLVILSALFTFLSYIFRSARWSRMLRHQKVISVRRLFPVLVSGFALNNVLPGRPGEFARAFAVGQREGLSKTLGLATVVVERVADGLTLIAILAMISLVFDLPGWGQEVEGISVAIFGLVLAVLLFLLFREHQTTQFLRRVIHLLPARIGHRIGDMLGSFIMGLHSLRSPRDLFAIVLLSLATWACEAAHYFLILTAFGILNVTTVRSLAALFTMVIVNLSISIPAAPGGVGPFEAAGVLALSAFSVPKDQALPAILVSHAVQFILITGLGIFFTAREGYKLTQSPEAIEAERVVEGNEQFADSRS